MILPLLFIDKMTTNTILSVTFFSNDTETTEIYTLSLHDALPIWELDSRLEQAAEALGLPPFEADVRKLSDRKSTRLNSSHVSVLYAVFCLKKKNLAALVSGVVINTEVASTLLSQNPFY